jgi:ATP-binding cassette subfamily F protein uup
MALITLESVKYGFAQPPLLDGIDLVIEKGERVGLVGRNGEGKTTLLRIICGDIQPDEGTADRQAGIRIGYLPQDIPADLFGTVEQVVCGGLTDNDPRFLESPWRIRQITDETISRLDLNPTLDMKHLSVGLKRRVLLAKAMASDPDVLLLDEPTNHLDIPSIEWLEDFLLRWKKTLFFVTHDRRFLKKLSTRIVEIDRGTLTNWKCSYDSFMARRALLLESEAKQAAESDRRLALEEKWLRGGLKARRKRNEGRVRMLEKLQLIRKQRRERNSVPSFQFREAELSNKLVLKAVGVNFAFEDRMIIRDLTTVILRGEKVGILGPNGSGKTTLLRLLCGNLDPGSGNISRSETLYISYFDQLRDQLDGEQTVMESVSAGREFLEIGKKSRHVSNYLRDFLFPPERMRTPVKVLSGGERNRLMLARLFASPVDLLVLDEPTNDLDAETLELLEQKLVDFEGTLLLVSHDREFLNNVVSSTLFIQSDGHVCEYVGGYDDFVRQSHETMKKPDKPIKASNKPLLPKIKPSRPRKLTFGEKQELDSLPERIEKLEADLYNLYASMSDPKFYLSDSRQVIQLRELLDRLEKTLKDSYDRWQELDAILMKNPKTGDL